MWMVIFGAGASLDSVPFERWSGRVDANLQPPLTVNLFDQRPIHVNAWTAFYECAPLINQLWHVTRPISRGSDAPSVEEFLQTFVTN
jgi:hypothetical protein